MRVVGIGGMIVLAASMAAAQTPLFREASKFGLPGSITNTFYLGTVIVADVGSQDGPRDGNLDVITANSSQLAPVKFGSGDGTFVNGPNVQLLTIPSALALADFDMDGASDLLVGEDRTVRWLRGNDDGTFQPPGAPADAGRGVAAILVDDVNGDQELDALVVNDFNQVPSAPGALRVLLGNGDGTFVTPAPSFTTGVGSTAGVLADFNRDGKIDVAVANAGSNDVSILLGDGAGGFIFGPVPAVGREPVAIAADDLNGDSQPDLIVVNRNADTVAVLDGRPGGTFAAARFFPSGSPGSTPNGLALADVNVDGHQDVLVSNSRTNDASVLLGDGSGNLRPPRAFVSDLEPQGVAAADFDGDDIPDVVTVNRGSDQPNLGVLLGQGDGTLFGVENVIAQTGPTAVVTGDVDNDGIADLIVALPLPSGPNAGVAIYRADPSVGFAPPSVLPSAGDVVAVAAADFNADGRLDIAAVNKSAATVSVFLGRAAGGFSQPRDYPTGAGASSVVAADWNRDGHPDLALARQGSGATGAADILLANADGSFRAPTSVPVGMAPVAIDFGDFNKDGRRDLVVANGVSNDLSVLIGNGDGTFQSTTTIPSPNGPRALAVGDFNHDGVDDLAVARTINSNVTVYFGDGQGGFPSAGPQLGLSGSASAVAARDLTGDLIPDILVTDQVANAVVAFVNSAGQFQDDSIGVSRGPISVAAADVDGDGRYDGAAANSFLAGSVSVLTNIGGTEMLRGDGNGDRRVSAADTLAVIRELGDGNGRRIEDVQVAGGAYAAAGGVDANGDGFVTAQDARAVAHRLFPGI